MPRPLGAPLSSTRAELCRHHHVKEIHGRCRQLIRRGQTPAILLTVLSIHASSIRVSWSNITLKVNDNEWSMTLLLFTCCTIDVLPTFFCYCRH
jgi:hypothetical protein